MSAQYIHGTWSHLFKVDGPAVTVRFVYDTAKKSMVTMDILRSNKWVKASRLEMADVLDSLQNANEDALENPAAWELDTADTIPTWATFSSTDETCRRSRSVQSWQDLDVFGIGSLTGEACAYSMRLLCDVSEKGKELLAEYFGMPEITLAGPWNSRVGDDPSVGSVMLSREELIPLAQFAFFRDGALGVVKGSGVIGIYEKELLDRYAAEPAIRAMHLVRNPAVSSSAPRIGSRNVHAMTGRAN